MSIESEDEREQSWGHRHAVTILTTVLFGLLGLVMFVQVSC
jgi:hypothetical protein